jgi:hypothetical protein
VPVDLTLMLKSVFKENLYQFSVINNINGRILDGFHIFIVGTSTVLSKYGGNRFFDSEG